MDMFAFLKKRVDNGLAAVGFETDSLCLARVEHSAGRPRLSLCVHETATTDWLPGLLADMASRHQLKRSRCTTVLGDGDYQLLLTEAPDVGADELKAALRWKIKDLIDFHINDATLDALELPGADAGARSREMSAVAARNEAIRRRVDLLTGAGVGLEIIDIQELAQRNIAALLPEDAAGVALLSLKAQTGLITITRQGHLYLSRPLNLGVDSPRSAGDPERYFDHIVLEVQRLARLLREPFPRGRDPPPGGGAAGRAVPGAARVPAQQPRRDGRRDGPGATPRQRRRAPAGAAGQLPGHHRCRAAPGSEGAMNQQVNLYFPVFRRQEKQFSAATIPQASLLVLTGIALMYAYAWWRTYALHGQLRDVNAQHTVALARLSDISSKLPMRHPDPRLEREVIDLEHRIQAVQMIRNVSRRDLFKGGAGYAETLVALARQSTPGLWLTGITITGASEALVLAGRTHDPELVPGYLQRLSNERTLAGLKFEIFQITRPSVRRRMTPRTPRRCWSPISSSRCAANRWKGKPGRGSASKFRRRCSAWVRALTP
ncbi:MAG: pilus assembly protein PilM [Chromatiales bacterium]|nr:pilus assembly protein PilM [Chromatiales bacterium]